MKKFLIAAAFLTLICSFMFVQQTRAGGCCFKSYSSTNGVAGQKDATIQVSFVDPKNPHVDEAKTTLSSLVNQKIVVTIVSPQAGQSCKTHSEKTDANGAIEVSCSSGTPGNMTVYFSAPEIDPEANQWLSAPQKVLYFDSNPDFLPMTGEVQETAVLEPSAVPTKEATNAETLELKNKIGELEKKIEKQQEEVNSLKSILSRVMEFLSNLFR